MYEVHYVKMGGFDCRIVRRGRTIPAYRLRGCEEISSRAETRDEERVASKLRSGSGLLVKRRAPLEGACNTGFLFCQFREPWIDNAWCKVLEREIDEQMAVLCLRCTKVAIESF